MDSNVARAFCTPLLFLGVNACVASGGTHTSPAATPMACLPTDPSWGCRGGLPSQQSTPTGLTPNSTIASTPQQSPTGAINPVPSAPPGPAAVAQPTVTGNAQTTTQAPNTSWPVSPTDDPLGRGDTTYMRNRVQAIVTELIASLEPILSTRVARIPLVFDPSRSEVNAYATCSRGNKAAVAVTDGMLVLTANLAQLKASDDVFGSRRVDEYSTYVAQYQRPNEAILAPPANWFTNDQRMNPGKLAREQQVFDEMIAFVFGHELAHHYLNHLPCTSVLPLDASELGILLTDAVPAFNQPNEAAADVAGIRNLLAAGKRRANSTLTETGALTQLRFFQALDNARPIDVFSFERTHPPPSVRAPIVQTAAQAFRATGGVTWPWGG